MYGETRVGLTTEQNGRKNRILIDDATDILCAIGLGPIERMPTIMAKMRVYIRLTFAAACLSAD